MPSPRRCAIYTRKSSEEGLEQDFNSLHAQREACEAYVVSQKHEGWRLITTLYDDGGYSGGSMERPGLKRLLADIAAGQIDVVVVYKVDRLTRALGDFAKIVEVFDASGVSFVSVTQAFNTTSSMGRLTLNVLLSFAQFEREVTGERIRDKIAASKKKGMWMGGTVPMGYRVAQRTLVIEPEEAGLVRAVFRRYLARGSVEALKRGLDADGIVTPLRVHDDRITGGGKPFGRGHLYQMLANPLYIGKIRHKGITYDGLHEAIIAAETWSAVQAQLHRYRHRERVSTRSKNPSLLAGLLSDATGRRLVASHANRHGRRYRYYRSLKPADGEGVSPAFSVAAPVIEGAVIAILTRHLRDQSWLIGQLRDQAIDHGALFIRAGDLADELGRDDAIAKRGVLVHLISAVRLGFNHIEIDLDLAALIGPDVPQADPQPNATTIREAMRLDRRGGEIRIVIPAAGPPDPEPDPALIKALAQAHRWWRDLTTRRFATLRELAVAYDTDERYAAFVLRLAFLSPELTRQILDGTQPYGLSLHHLLAKIDIPANWQAQLEMA